MIETEVVGASEVDNSARSEDIIVFSVFFNMKVCCVYSLESPH